jgi:hypothetical protein
LKSGSLKLLETSGPVQACNGIAFTFVYNEETNADLYAFFWVIPRRLNMICRRFGTPCFILIG